MAVTKPFFSIEHQYKLYLERGNITEAQLPPAAKRELKRAFVGAWGQLLMLLRNDIPALNDEEAIEALEDMITQVGQFWQNEAN